MQGEQFYNYYVVQQVDSSNDINSSYTWTDLSQADYQFSVVAFTNKGAGETARLMLPRLPINGKLLSYIVVLMVVTMWLIINSFTLNFIIFVAY